MYVCDGTKDFGFALNNSSWAKKGMNSNMKVSSNVVTLCAHQTLVRL